MSSTVANLLNKLFPSTGTEGRLLCLGLDASGRTAWLYSKVLSYERITTIPTIGFNVETVKHNGCALTIWDVGGCDKIRPLWRHYFQNTQGLVFFVDSNDHSRLDEVRGDLKTLAESPELSTASILVVANKQDLPNALSPSQISERLQLPAVLGGRLWTCLPGCLGNKQLTEGHFNWLVAALQQTAKHGAPTATATAQTSNTLAPASHPGAPSATQAASVPVDDVAPQGGEPRAGSRQPPAAVADGGGSSAATAAAATAAAGAVGGAGGGDGGGGAEPDLLERWLAVEDEPDEEFLRKLEDFSLEVWDHRTHLRLAWLYLTRLGRRAGLQAIHTSIRAFIAHSPVTRRRTGTTYHETMTYFWAHMVHFAIASTKLPAGVTPDFRTFLLLNPQLTNGGLFLHYYSKKLMLMTPESRDRVVLPDKRPLPSIITDLESLSLKQERGHIEAPAAAAPGPSLTTDAVFLERFLSRSLDRWNHECLLRAIYCCLEHHGRRRGGNIALDGLQALQGEAFHLTINYFWVCIITHTLANEYSVALFADRTSSDRVTADIADGCTEPVVVSVAAGSSVQGVGGGMPEWMSLLDNRSYTAVRLKELVADEQHYLRYYSKKLVFSDDAAKQFLPPDKGSLPTMV